MSDVASMVTVINPVEGKRYKMSMKGDVSRLTVRKIKKYLSNSCGILPEEQCLKYNGIELGDDVLGGEVGISTGSTLTVERKGPDAQPFLASPVKQALEMETLDQQRAILQHERMRRDEEFRRHQEALQGSISSAEARRRELEREKMEKEAELKRLADLEAQAERESERLRAYREAEAEREAMRARDLEARKEQLARERAMQRQLEMQKLENERKKMLLAQQEAEYEAEKARVERERREHAERVKKQELAIREKEVEMERAKVEADRARRELEMEKAMILQQRHAENFRLSEERIVDSSRLHDALNQTKATYSTPAPNRSMSNHSLSIAPGAASMSHPAVGRSASIVEKERELERLRQQQQELEAEVQYEKELDRQIEEQKSALSRGPSTVNGGTRPGASSTPIVTVAPSNVPFESKSAVPNRTAATPTQPFTGHAPSMDPRSLALDNLAHLAQDLGVPSLVFDDNNTCVVSVEDKYTLLITFDPQTARLYLYSTLATFIPQNPDTKLKLYEFLMEGALLGRDMCGGGVGASLKNDFILMSTSIYLPTSTVTSLKIVAPQFVDSLIKWRARVKDLLAADDFGLATSDGSVAQSGGAVRGPPRAASRHRSPDAPDSGAEYPHVGIEVTDGVTVDGVMSKYDDGVVVVSCKGPAARAGILPNDHIRAVNGRPVNSLKTFQSVIQALRPHTTVPFSLDRAGSHLVVSVLVGGSASRPGEARYKNIVRVNENGL